MTKILCSVLALGLLTACGPDAVKRASEDPWSSKNQSIKSVNESANTSNAPKVVDGNTVKQSALSLLLDKTESNNPRFRANAIEALRYAPNEPLERVLRFALGDDNRGVRFVAAMMIGEKKLCSLSILLEPLLLDESESVQAAALYSLYRCGSKVDLNLLARMLQSGNPELQGNAAMVLGMMGNTSAVQMIRDALKVPQDLITPIRRRLINLQMAEALILLGERNELEVVRAAIFSSAQEAEVTALACQIAGRLGDVEVVSTLESITMSPKRYPDEIRLVAATSLAEITPQRMPLELVLSFSSNDSANIRSQCATALGVQGYQLSLGPLALMLKDVDPLVQISAAGGILRINNGDSMPELD
ncbi:MAG TPA: HEAT repeat domain-containing protein [Phycisphaerales bacterium]|nr:HEAT repeat domain-containing protein [Phycisphaerales bacterium]HIB51236.1 HEAT repeat domain-containing protein [Phycisphaerales bacterium]HIN83373.1 HEAT repeat domain-containing protein [Phycisphaerales bacterium]HIO19584.1 HEAT repeat domain-containing protein [Phycisphaerales bacterium]HIO53449.1 HEAT repeat domain-containing protein [Phycisphaerales bacterium]